MTHTKDLRARVVTNTILFLFILQETEGAVVSHDQHHMQLPLLWWQFGASYIVTLSTGCVLADISTLYNLTYTGGHYPGYIILCIIYFDTHCLIV